MFCNVANANLFNLNTYAYCKKHEGGTMFGSDIKLFSYIAYDNNYLKFKYTSYSKKFLIEELYSGEKILKTNIKNNGKIFEIIFDKETGILNAVKKKKTYIFYCKKIKKNQLPKSEF